MSKRPYNESEWFTRGQQIAQEDADPNHPERYRAWVVSVEDFGMLEPEDRLYAAVALIQGYRYQTNRRN